MCIHLGAYFWGYPESEVSQKHRHKVIDPHSKTLNFMIFCSHCFGYLQSQHNKKRTEERSHQRIEVKTPVILRGYVALRLRLFLIFLGVLGRLWNSFSVTSTSTAKFIDLCVYSMVWIQRGYSWLRLEHLEQLLHTDPIFIYLRRDTFLFCLKNEERSCIKTNKEAYLTRVPTACHAVFAMASGSHFGRRSHLLVRLPKLLTCLSSSVLRRLPSHLTKLIELR